MKTAIGKRWGDAGQASIVSMHGRAEIAYLTGKSGAWTRIGYIYIYMYISICPVFWCCQWTVARAMRAYELESMLA